MHHYYNMDSVLSSWAQLQNVYTYYFYITINKKYAVANLLWH